MLQFCFNRSRRCSTLHPLSWSLLFFLFQERLVEFSTCLEDEALYTLMSSLQALAVVDLANTATVLPQERTSARERE